MNTWEKPTVAPLLIHTTRIAFSSCLCQTLSIFSYTVRAGRALSRANARDKEGATLSRFHRSDRSQGIPTMEKPTSELYGGQSRGDRDIWAEIMKILHDHNIPITDVLESFAIYSRRINITRFLAHYELYRMVKDVPGSIVECGIYQGNSFFAFMKFLEIFHPGDRIRHVIGFDSFNGLRDFDEKDGPLYPNRSKIDGGWSANEFRSAFFALLDTHQADAFVPKSKRGFVIEGDILETVPKYVADNPGLRISLLHLDVDIYKPTLCALEYMYPRVVTGGLVVLDEYAMMEWGGESSALEDYFEGAPPALQKFHWTSTPGGFFIKEGDSARRAGSGQS